MRMNEYVLLALRVNRRSSSVTHLVPHKPEAVLVPPPTPPPTPPLYATTFVVVSIVVLVVASLVEAGPYVGPAWSSLERRAVRSLILLPLLPARLTFSPGSAVWLYNSVPTLRPQFTLNAKPSVLKSAHYVYRYSHPSSPFVTIV